MNKDFEQIFIPMYYLTTICCMRKIKFKKHKMSIITKKDVILSVLANVGIVILFYIMIAEVVSYSVSPLMFYVYILAYLLYMINHIFLKTIIFVQRKSNLAMFLNLQNIYKHLGLKKQLNKLKWQLILSCTIIIGAFLILNIYKLSMDSRWSWTRGLFIFLTVSFDLELIYSGFIIFFLSKQIETWAKILGNIDERVNNYEAVIQKMHSVFNMLMEAVRLNNKTFRLSVIIY